MRPLEEALILLADRAEPLPVEVLLERIEWQLATADAPSTTEEPTMPTHQPRQLQAPTPTPPPRRWRRPLVAFGAAAIITVSVIGVVGAIGPFGDDSDTAGTAPTTSTPPTVTTDALQPQTTVPADAGLFDYGSVGEPVVTLDSPLGTLTWIRAGGIPREWLQDGFPAAGDSGGEPPIEDLLEVFVKAPGVDVFGSDVGFLGIGPAGDPDGLRGSACFINTCYRLRGLTEDEDPYQLVELQQTRLMDREGITIEAGGDGRWTGYDASENRVYEWRLPLDEVWYSADGRTWGLKTATGFEPGAMMASHPLSVAEHDGRWIVIGWIAASEADNRPAAGTPAAWTSEDLVTWTRVPLDFAKPGRITRLTSVAGGDQGWVIFGTHATEEIARQGDWAAWASSDGLGWEPLPIEEFLDPADCPDPINDCRITPIFTDDALVAYVWTRPDGFMFEWRLWIATLEEGNES